MDKLAQLQTALRAIETGQHLESVDGVLVQQVLLHPRVQQQPAPKEPEAKDFYQELLALRKANAKSIDKQKAKKKAIDDGNVAIRTTQKVSPKKTSNQRLEAPTDLRPDLIGSSFDNRDFNKGGLVAEKLQADTTKIIDTMQVALVTRNQELRRSEKAVARADAELREELARAERILPCNFLFERNLAGDRALEAARNVLIRFQHRFFQLYFRRWWATTLAIRLQIQRRAVYEIMRVYRGHWARQQARRLRRELSTMNRQRLQLLLFRMKYRASQALKLQMAWRRFLRKRAMKQRQSRHAAARLLQKAFRKRQWRSQSLINALADTRKLYVAVSIQKLYRGHRARCLLAESRRRQRQEEQIRLALLRNISKQARTKWIFERRGAGFLIAHRAIFPYAMRCRWWRVLFLLRRQRAAKCIARVVCKWFGVEARREIVRVRQTTAWLALVQREHLRSRFAAMLIQKHLRRWVQQRKFLVSEARRKKLAKRTRLEMKARLREMQQQQQHNDQKLSAPVSGAAERKTRRLPNYRLSPQPAQLMSAFKSIQANDVITRVSSRTDAKAVIILQKCYRRYRARKRAQISVWQRKAKRVEARVLQRHRSATNIQRHVRGFQGRRMARQRRAERLILHFMLRWRWRRIRKRHIAARKIGRWFKRKRTQQRAKLWRFESENRLASTFQVQRWFRLRCLLPSRLGRLLRIARKQEESIVFGDQSLRLCRQHVADAVAVQSLRASLEEALRPLLSNTPAGRSAMSPSKVKGSPTRQRAMAAVGSKRKPTIVAFPILQMVFLVVCGWKMPLVWRELDGKSLFQTRLERAKAVSFFRSLRKRGKPVASSTHQAQQSVLADAAALSPSRHNQKSPSKGAKGVAVNDTFSSVEVDVAVARATGGAKGALDYAVFVHTLELLGEITLAQQSQDTSPFWGRYDGSEARVLALLWCSLFQHMTIQLLALQFDSYLSDEMSRYASCLQRFFGRHCDKLKGAILLAEKRRDLRNQELSRAAVVLQMQVRKLLARRALRLRMQETYEKYFDPTWGLPYWMNPRSGYSTWLKPLRLGAEDVRSEPVPFPPPERTLKAHCNGRKNCDRCAQWVCYDCDELFCLECFEEYHKAKTIPTSLEQANDNTHDLEELELGANDGANSDTEEPGEREHELERLLLCGLCQFQLASRRCLDCLPKSGKAKTLPAPRTNAKANGKQKQRDPTEVETHDKSEDLKNESLFCDVCFEFLHRRGGLRAHRMELLLESCTSCIPNNDESSLEQQTHVYDLPGAGDAVQWECEACGDPPLRVCGRCALHSHPKESCGELRIVPLQTQGRRGRAKRLREEQDARDRKNLDRMRAKALRARQEKCARKLQAFWRSQMPILRARRMAAALRKEKSDLWLRHVEDARLAKRFGYRAKNALGIAPPLSTDSPVERRLRSLNAAARRQLGIRARFFGLLVDEYVTVGIPLPGMGLLRPGSNELWTTEDLRGWARNRQTLRLKKLTDQESEPAERALCAWRQLESWGKAANELGRLKGEGATSSSVADSWLADIHAKEVIAENVVPLAQSYEMPQLQKRRDEEDNLVEDIPVAMFLVEFSLDPRRTVWISHSLAERLWEWKRLKLLARSERAAQRQRAAEYKKEWQERQVRLRKQEEDAAAAAEIQAQAAEVDTIAAAYSAWPTPAAEPNLYYDYEAPANAEAWTGYDAAYTTDYSATYQDYGYSSATTTALEASGLVDSGSYYPFDSSAVDSSNWCGTDYDSVSAEQQSADYCQWSEDWEEVFDPSSNQSYYVNRVTNETAWQLPS